MEDPGTSPEGRKNRSFAVGLLAVGALILSVAVAGVAMRGYFNDKQISGAGAALEQPTVNAQAIQEQQNRDAEEKGQEAAKVAQEQEAHRMQMEAENLQVETEKGLCAPDADPAYRTNHCVTVTILQSQMVNITHTDENGYEHILRNGLQRLTVTVELPKTGQGLFELYGQLFNGDVATADILCLLRCPELDVGTRHNMGIATVHVNDVRLPYLSIGNNKWQVLELCHDTIQDRCTALSTPYAGY